MNKTMWTYIKAASKSGPAYWLQKTYLSVLLSNSIRSLGISPTKEHSASLLVQRPSIPLVQTCHHCVNCGRMAVDPSRLHKLYGTRMLRRTHRQRSLTNPTPHTTPTTRDKIDRGALRMLTSPLAKFVKWDNIGPQTFKKLESSSLRRQLMRALQIRNYVHSALYVSGTDTSNVAVVDVDLDLENRLSDIDALHHNLEKRKMDSNVYKLVSDYRALQNIIKRQQSVEAKREEVAATMKELVKMQQRPGLVKEKELLIQQGKELRRQTKDLNVQRWAYEEKVMATALRLPNVLHPATPDDENIVVLEHGSIPGFAFKPRSHVELGRKRGQLSFSDLGDQAYYLTGDLAELELSMIQQVCDHLNSLGYQQMACPEMVKTLVVEGCGVDFLDSNQVYTLELKASDTEQRGGVGAGKKGGPPPPTETSEGDGSPPPTETSTAGGPPPPTETSRDDGPPPPSGTGKQGGPPPATGTKQGNNPPPPREQGKWDITKHLVGVSPMAFAAYLTKMNVETQSLPLLMFSTGRSYSPVPATTDSSLLNVSQKTVVDLCAAVRGPSDCDDIFQEFQDFLVGMYQQLDLHFRMVSVASPGLRRAESRRVDVEAWLPSQHRFITVASVSDFGDFIGRRLMLKHSDNVDDVYSRNYLHVVYARAVSFPDLLAVVMETSQTKDGRWKLPGGLAMTR